MKITNIISEDDGGTCSSAIAAAPAQNLFKEPQRRAKKSKKVVEGKVKELSQDLNDKTLSAAEFKKKYGKSRAEVKKEMKQVKEGWDYNLEPPDEIECPRCGGYQDRSYKPVPCRHCGYNGDDDFDEPTDDYDDYSADQAEADWQAGRDRTASESVEPVKEAHGLNKRVKIVAGPAKGKTGTVGEVRHGMFKGAPKEFTIDLDDGGNVRCSAKQLRLIKPMAEAIRFKPGSYPDVDHMPGAVRNDLSNIRNSNGVERDMPVADIDPDWEREQAELRNKKIGKGQATPKKTNESKLMESHFIGRYTKDGESYILWQKGHYQYSLTSGTQDPGKGFLRVATFEKGLEEVEAELEQRGFSKKVTETGSEKEWFNNAQEWKKAVSSLSVADDGPDWAKDSNGKLIAKWYTDRNEGWVIGDQLNELSNDTLRSYKTKAAIDAGKHDKAGNFEKGNKRFHGIIKATHKQFDNAVRDAKRRQSTNEPVTEDESSEGALLVKLSKVIKSAQTPEQLESAKKFANLAFNQIAEKIKRDKGFGGYGSTIKLLKQIKDDIKMRASEISSNVTEAPLDNGPKGRVKTDNIKYGQTRNMTGGTASKEELARRREQQRAENELTRQAKKAKDEYYYGSKSKSAAPKASPELLNKIWYKVEDVVGSTVPDGDPIDYIGPWCEKNGIPYEYVTKAARMNGYKDMYDYYNEMVQHYNELTQDYGNGTV